MSDLTHISRVPSEALVQTTLQAFQPYYEQELTRSDAIEIIESVVNYSKALLELENTLESGLCKVTIAQTKPVQKIRKS